MLPRLSSSSSSPRWGARLPRPAWIIGQYLGGASGADGDVGGGRWSAGPPAPFSRRPFSIRRAANAAVNEPPLPPPPPPLLLAHTCCRPLGAGARPYTFWAPPSLLPVSSWPNAGAIGPYSPASSSSSSSANTFPNRFLSTTFPNRFFARSQRNLSSAAASAASSTDPAKASAAAAAASAATGSNRKKRPRRPPIPRDKDRVALTRWQSIASKIRHLRDFLSLYWQSIKLFAAEVRLAFRLAYNIYLKGHRYTRAERRAMQKAAVDIIKVLPLASMTMVVGTEITALLAARAIPNMLPGAFRPVADKVDENLPKFVDKVLPSGKDRRKADADTKVEVADNLHALSLEHVSRLQRQMLQRSKDAAAYAANGATAAVAVMHNSGGESSSLGGAAAAATAARGSGGAGGKSPFMHDENVTEYVAEDAKVIAEFLTRMDDHEAQLTARDIALVGPAFRRHMQLQQLSRMQLVRMNQYMNQGSELMNLVLPTFVLVRRLRAAIAAARTDDKDIHFEGVSTLSADELRDACMERGLYRDTDMPSELSLRNRLRNWISLSINRDVPSSLLILSSALISRSQLRLEQEYGLSALQAETLRARINELDQLISKRTQQRQEVQQKLDLLLEAQDDVGKQQQQQKQQHQQKQQQQKQKQKRLLQQTQTTLTEDEEETETREVLAELETLPDDIAQAEAEAIQVAAGLVAENGSGVGGGGGRFSRQRVVVDHFTDYEPEDILLVRGIFEKYQDGDESGSMLRGLMLESLEVVGGGGDAYEEGLCEEIVDSYLRGLEADSPALSWAEFLAAVSDLHRSVDVVQSQEFASARRLRESRELIASRALALAQIEGILAENPEEVEEGRGGGRK